MKNIIAAIVLASTAFGVNAASFDCSKAASKSEKFICANPSISDLDSKMHEVYVKAVKIDPSLKQEQRAWNKNVRDTMINVGQIQPLEAVYNAQIQNLMNVLPKEETASESVVEAQKEVVKEEAPEVVEQPVATEPKKNSFAYICKNVTETNIVDGMSVDEKRIDMSGTKIRLVKNDDGTAKILVRGFMNDNTVVDLKTTESRTMINIESTRYMSFVHTATFGLKFDETTKELVDDESKLTYIYTFANDREEKEVRFQYDCVEEK